MLHVPLQPLVVCPIAPSPSHILLPATCLDGTRFNNTLSPPPFCLLLSLLQPTPHLFSDVGPVRTRDLLRPQQPCVLRCVLLLVVVCVTVTAVVAVVVAVLVFVSSSCCCL